jgi:branched-chain amino acid transport system permease protein
MEITSDSVMDKPNRFRERLRTFWIPYARVPLLGWLLGTIVALLLETLIGQPFARALGMSKLPALFGVVLALDKPVLIPSAVIYLLVMYFIPVAVVARFTSKLSNRVAERLFNLSPALSILVHILLLYAALYLWTEVSDYRLLVGRLTLIAIIITLSLNVINGYMGEFSCSHPGFMALGAYTASVFTIVLFVQENRFGAPLLPPELGPFLFPIGLIFGGIVAAIGALLVAIPSFRTRGDYLAIISLAFMFIVISLFNNLEVVGGPRGLSNQPNYATLPVIFIWTILSIWIINNFVRSTMGKALNAVRDGELAASAMTVDTRKTKMIAFLFSAFWAGIGGGLFGHVLGYINPGTFGILTLAEVLAMVYLGGLNSVSGSVVGAISMNLLSEGLRPLEILKWIIIPVILILVMIFRPTGLIAFTDLDPVSLVKPKSMGEEEVERAAA